MVQLTSYLSLDAIALDVQASDKAALLACAGDCMARVVPELDAAAITALLSARERVASTGVGEGVAIPHATCEALTAPRVGLLRAAVPVDFDAIDREPVRLVLVVLAPKNAQALHLRLLARIARLVRAEHNRSGLFAATTAEEALAVLSDHEAAAGRVG